MRILSVKQFKAKLSKALHSTEDGVDLIITHRGKPAYAVTWIGGLDLEDYILANHSQFTGSMMRDTRNTYGARRLATIP